MRARTAVWFECKVRYDKTQDDGTQKKVTELYVVDALSFTEAEQRVSKEMTAYISGSFEVSDIKKACYKEVFFADNDTADRWFKVKIQIITIDEKTEKEKLSSVYYLMNAGTLPAAVKNMQNEMRGGMSDYYIAAVQETMIIEVYEYTSKK